MYSIYFWDLFQNLIGAHKEKIKLYNKFFKLELNSKILDFGCATGIMANTFNNCKYLGIDINEKAIFTAKKKYQGFDNIEFRYCNINDLKDTKFNHILFAGTGHHLTTEQIQEILCKMKLLLEKNGKIHFIDVIKNKNDNIITKIFLFLDKGKFIRNYNNYKKIFLKIDGLQIIKTVPICNIKTLLCKFTFCYFQLIF